MRKELRPLRLQPRQARIMVTMGNLGPLSQAALARAFDVSRPSMTVMVERLLRDGLVDRHQALNQRRSLVRLSERGAALVPAIEDAWTRVDAELGTRLGDELQQALGAAALRARDRLGGRAPHEVLMKGDR